MRFHPCLFAAVALASCGGPEQGDGGETANITVPSASATGDPAANLAAPVAAAPAETPANIAAPATAADAIPASFRGVYDESREACGRPSEYRLRVSDKALRFHESIGTIVDVAVRDPRGISILADYEGEGEKWQSRRQLDLAEDGATLVVSGDGTSMTRVRCP